jgi:hypothetical protein
LFQFYAWKPFKESDFSSSIILINEILTLKAERLIRQFKKNCIQIVNSCIIILISMKTEKQGFKSFVESLKKLTED